MPAEQHLAKFGVTVDQAHQFIQGNLDSPETIYQVAAQYEVTFDMLAEIYSDDIDGDIVRSFFSDLGMVTSDDAPLWDDDYEDGDYDVMFGRLDLDLDDLLELEDEDIAASDWDSLFDDYLEALSNFDWDAWGDSIAEALANFDWSSWTTQMTTLANTYASDTSWLTTLDNLTDSWIDFELDSLFDDMDWSWDDWEEESEDDDDDFDFGNFDYSEYLAALGLTEDYFTTLFSAVDWESYLDQVMLMLQNLDLSSFGLDSIDYDEFYENIASMAEYYEVSANSASSAPEFPIAEIIGVEQGVDFT
ncbi:hypothetical protein [Marinomonas ostreistagni]|uniref:Uncharacterized protein n=1 Tax=Marinomonas ostreistagni TaxID=359209 RepID=A0ABS0ZCW7_9GAMM|nr:hypothetical protein [Marinomonas ostreistagni]MBJ7551518.1 hypothetical protein [Marinomonas ostreistagni]